jgi:hypothetical protein
MNRHTHTLAIAGIIAATCVCPAQAQTLETPETLYIADGSAESIRIVGTAAEIDLIHDVIWQVWDPDARQIVGETIDDAKPFVYDPQVLAGLGTIDGAVVNALIRVPSVDGGIRIRDRLATSINIQQPPADDGAGEDPPAEPPGDEGEVVIPLDDVVQLADLTAEMIANQEVILAQQSAMIQALRDVTAAIEAIPDRYHIQIDAAIQGQPLTPVTQPVASP